MSLKLAAFGTDPSGGVVVVGSAAAVWGHLWVRRLGDV